MAGNWLATLGRSLVRPETFETLVSPAIADLQSEATRGPLTAASFIAAFFVVGMIVMQLEISLLRGVPSYAYQRWRDVGVTFFVTAMWLLATRRTPRRPEHQHGEGTSGLPARL